MDREKNERLTMRKIEEEEMKRKLTDIGIYEPEFTYKEMKRLLGFINESQDTSKVASNNNDTHRGQHNNQHLPETTSDTSASQEAASQESTELPRPSYSYKLNRASPTVHEHKSTTHYNNQDSPPLFEVRNPMYRRKSSDSDDVLEKQLESTNSTHSTNRLLSLRSSNPREGQNVAQDTTQGDLVQRLERWRLNPLDLCINENDVPLRQPNRSWIRERVLFRYCKETHTSEQRDQAIRLVGQHLKEVADLWYGWHPAANSIFQWGSPIQVGTANGSLDKNPLTESKTEQSKTETCRDSHERASKRKASSRIANLTRDSSTEDEEDKWHNCSHDKKRKTVSKSSNVDENHQQVSNDCHERATSRILRQGKPINDSNSDADPENEHVKSVRSRKTDEEEDESVSTDLNIYPRRIVPPNPSKPRPRQRRAAIAAPKPSKKSRANKAVEQTKKQKSTLTDGEIEQLIEEWDVDEERVAMKKNVEMRPLPIPKEVRSRLHEKRLSLRHTRVIKETRTKEEENDGQKREKRPKLGEREEEESCRIRNGNQSWERQLMSDDEDSLFDANQDVQNGNQSDNEITLTNNVNCPICNKLFPHSEIENHAADCEQFEMNNEEDSNDAIKLECNICGDYKISNGVKYEERVQQCINRQNKRLSGDLKISMLHLLLSYM